MGGIYAQAAGVYAYLGPADDLPAIPTDFPPGNSDEIDTQILFALANVFNRPYWRRVWIVPELRLAKQVLFWYSDQILRKKTSGVSIEMDR
jgi:hypothetical protein